MKRSKIILFLVLTIILFLIILKLNFKNNINKKIINIKSTLHFLNDTHSSKEKKKEKDDESQNVSHKINENHNCHSYIELFKSKTLDDILDTIKREYNVTEKKISLKNIDIKFKNINGELNVLTFTYETNNSGSTSRSATLIKFDSKGYPTPKRLPLGLDKKVIQYFNLKFPNAKMINIQKEMYLDFNDKSVDFTVVDDQVTSLTFKTKNNVYNCDTQKSDCTCTQ